MWRAQMIEVTCPLLPGHSLVSFALSLAGDGRLCRVFTHTPDRDRSRGALPAHGVQPVHAHTATTVPTTVAIAPTMVARATTASRFRRRAHQPSLDSGSSARAVVASRAVLAASR